MPHELSLTIKYELLQHELLPRLTSNVFHVTSRARYASIVADGEIRGNKNGELGDTFCQSAISYGRAKGYISLLDLRTQSDERIEKGLQDLYFLAPSELGSDLAFLLLRSDTGARVLAWQDVAEEAGPGAFRMHYLECWSATAIPISDVGLVLLVTVIPTPMDPTSIGALHLDALRQVAKARRGC